MALLTGKLIQSKPASILEVPGKIYIEGQGHDVTTLTPIFNDFHANRVVDQFSTKINLPSDTNPQTIPNNITTLYSCFGVGYVVKLVSNSNNYLPADASYVDAGQRLVSTAKLRIDRPGEMIVLNNDTNAYLSTGSAPVLINYETGAIVDILQRVNPTDTASCGACFVVDEDETQFLIVTAPMMYTNPYPGAGTSSILYESYMVSVSKIDGSVKNIISPSSATSSRSSLITILSKENGVTHFAITSYSSGSSNVTFRAIDRQLTARSTGITFSGVGMGTPSNPVGLDGDRNICYVAEYNLNTFVTLRSCEYKKSSVSTQALSKAVSVSNHVVPHFTNQSNSQLNGVTFPTFAFVTGEFRYVVVATTAATVTRSSVPEGFNRIQIYRAPLADPYSFEFVRAVMLRPSVEIVSFLPLTTDYSKFAVVYKSGGVDFIEWNKTVETYVVSGSTPVQPAYYGVDQLGRFWMVDNENSPNIHYFSPSVSRTVRVGFEDKTVVYLGTPTETTLLVSAFDFEGARSVSEVSLTIDGTTALFSNGTNKIVVTTKENADLHVPITLVGSGQVQVIANLA